ncbi:Transposase family Tnp2 protein [Ceratobasidium sp. AG-Ba]|nr:Transposase family Tnp2 protein [Ceratobasidium sp. AG-Ba]QRW08572.1 Transposase family Tnp2 protein [Ceratobasidium sp. AG-Ba]
MDARTCKLKNSDDTRKVAEFISTRIPVSAAFIRNKLLDHPFVAWGKMQRIIRNEAGDITGGDLIRGHHIVANNCESRDASHIMYWSINSHWRWDRGPAVVLDEETFGYGRAEQFLVIDAAFLRHVTECAGVFYPHLDHLVLAVVSPIPYLRHIASSGITQYGLRGGKYVSPEILDASKIDCLVGRVRSPLVASYIVQRDTAVGQLDMLDEVVNPD